MLERLTTGARCSLQAHKAAAPNLRMCLDNVEIKMSDDKTKRGPRDAARINLGEEYEVRYWSEKFGVSKEDLAYAVQRVGSMANDVEAELKNDKGKWG